MNNESTESALRLPPALTVPGGPSVTFPAQFDVPLIEENQLPFTAAAGSLTFHLLQLTDLAATILILHDDAHQELTELPLGPAGGIPLCPGQGSKGQSHEWKPQMVSLVQHELSG